MKVSTSNLLPWLVVIVAIFWTWQLNVLAHETCNNEQRYENQVMCEDKQFGCLVPYPDNCSLFLVCDCLYPTVKLCPAQLWWDNSTQQCNYPQAVDCIYYSIDTPEPTDGTTQITPQTTERTTQTSPKPTTTEETSTTPSDNYPTSSWDPPPPPPGISEDICQNDKDGTLYRYPYDCQVYINCTHGWPVLNYCQPDKVFNDLLKICDTPEVADCEELPLPSTTTEMTTISTTELAPTSTTELAPTSTTEGEVVCGPTPENIPEDYCMPLGNGFYEYPYNCSGYLACRNGCTDLEYCQPDKLFNNWLHICDTPDSVSCDPTPYPTTPGVTEKPTTLSTPTTIRTTTSEGNESTESSTATTEEEVPTTTPGLPADVDPNDCKGLPDGTIFAYAGNCSQYLICEDDQVKMGECPPTLLFNPNWLVCDEPGDFICLGDSTTTPVPTTKPTTTTEQTTPTPTTSTTKATTLGPTELCEGQEMGASFAYPADCSKYYLCMGNGGQWFLVSCMYGSYFDPSTGICGPDVSPDACKAVDTTTTTTTVASTTTERTTTPKPTTAEPSTTQKEPTTTEAPATGVCAGRNENENIAYPKNCNKYIVCVSPIPIAFYCPDDTYFSSELQKCIGSWEDSDCEGDQSTTTSEPGFTKPPPEPTMCTNSTRDTFPYPDNCQWFIRCVDDYIYMMDVCNCGEYYDPISEKCGADVPSDACRWDYTSTTTTTEEPTTASPVTRPPPQKGPCDDVDDGALVPYPNDCSKYIKCNRPIAEAFDCDEGDEFSVALGKCVDASLANCSITTTAKPPASTTTPSTSTSAESTTDYPTTPTTESSTSSSTELTTESTTESSTVTPTESTTLSTTEPSTVSSTENPTESSTLSSTVSSTDAPTESTTLSTTSEPGPGTTTAKPGGGVCSGQTDGSLVPYPRNCSKYIICEYPIPVGYDCPTGLEFSPTELICMDPELAGCSPKVTTTEEPTTTGSTTTPKTTSQSTTVSTTPTTTESTTVSTTPTTTESTTVSTTPTTTESTTVSTTPITTESTTVSTTESTTVSTTPTTTESTTVSTTPKTTTESTTVSTTPTTTESTTVSTTAAPPITLDPYTPNICCGQPLGTLLAYPNDCSRYVVCDYPIPYAVDCDEGTVFDDKYLQCTATPNEKCLFNTI